MTDTPELRLICLQLAVDSRNGDPLDLAIDFLNFILEVPEKPGRDAVKEAVDALRK